MVKEDKQLSAVERLGDLAQRAPMPVVGVDADGCVTYVNDSLCGIIGYDREELLGRRFWEFLPPDDAEALREQLEAIPCDGLRQRFDTTVLTRHAGELEVSWHAIVFRDEKGEIAEVYAIGADITVLRRAERRLERLNRCLHALSDISGLALRSEDPGELVESACNVLVDGGVCTRAWVALVGDSGSPIGIVGSRLPDGSMPDEVRGDFAEITPCIREVLSGTDQVVISDVAAACGDCLFKPPAPDIRGIATAIRHAGSTPGTLVAHVQSPRAPGDEVRQIFAAIADDLGFALAMLEARTLHERVQRTLAERTRTLDAFFESSLDPAAIMDRDFNFIRVNEAYAASCERTADELKGQNHFALFPNEENQALFERVRDSGEPLSISVKPFEFPEHPEWGVTWWDWALVPTLDDEGNVVLLTLWLRDVTEEQRAKQELEAQRDSLDELVRERTAELHSSNQLLRAVVEESPVAICIINMDGTISLWNRAAEELSGFAAEEIVDKPSPQVLLNSAEETRELLEQLIAGEIVSEVEMQRPHADGHMMDLRLSAAPLYDPDGKVQSAVALFRDVTERERAQRERQELMHQLDEERATLRAIFDNAPAGIIVADAECRVMMANSASEQIYNRPLPLGQERDTHAGLQICYPDGTPCPLDDLPLTRSCLHGEVLENIDLSIIWPDGQKRHVVASTVPIRTDGGEIAGGVGIVQDVTEFRATQRERDRLLERLEDYAEHLEQIIEERTRDVARSRDELRIQRDFVDAVIENAGSLVVVVDNEGRIARFNESAARVSGWSVEEALGRNFIELLIPEEDRALVSADFGRGLEEMPSSVYESRWRSRNGDIRVISWSVSLMFDEHGDPSFMIGSGWDVTEERRMSRALAESETQYRELVEGAQSIIIRLTMDGYVVFMNEFGLRFFGYSADELIGQHISILTPEVDSGGTDFAGLVDKIASRPESHWTNENENIARDGTRHWISWSNRVIRDESGEMTGVLAIGIDRTAQKEAEDEVRASREELRDLAARLALTEQRERREIATTLHDELGQILAFAKLKLSSLSARTQLEFADLDPVLTYLDDAIGFVRSLTSQLAPPVLRQLGFSAALQWLTDEIRKRQGVPIVYECHGAPVSLREEVEVTLFQAVRELITNSLKHGKPGQVNVLLSVNDSVLSVAVADDGRGFDPAALPPRSTESGGFGLLNVRERIEYLGGQMEIAASPGAGARIRLIYPME